MPKKIYDTDNKPKYGDYIQNGVFAGIVASVGVQLWQLKGLSRDKQWAVGRRQRPEVMPNGAAGRIEHALDYNSHFREYELHNFPDDYESRNPFLDRQNASMDKISKSTANTWAAETSYTSHKSLDAYIEKLDHKIKYIKKYFFHWVGGAIIAGAIIGALWCNYAIERRKQKLFDFTN